MAEETSRIQHIWCSVAISKKMEDVFTQYVINQAQNISEYIVYLSTLGGNPFAAISLYNFMKSIPQKTTVYNMGTVASAGVPFFLSFQTRIGVPDCSFLIHQTSLPRTALPGNFNVFDIDIQKANLEAIDNKTQKIILKETTAKATEPFTSAAISAACLKSTTYHAADAQKYGFIDKIEVPKLPPVGVLYITDQLLATLPGQLN